MSEDILAEYGTIPHADVRVLCAQLEVTYRGLDAIGLRAEHMREAGRLLAKMSREIHALRTSPRAMDERK